MDKIRAEIEKDLGPPESRSPIRLPNPPDPDRSRLGEFWRKYHSLVVAPGVLAAVGILALSDRVWTIRGRGRHGAGATLGASTLWIVAITLGMYFGGPLLARITGATPRLGMTAPTDAQLGCAGAMFRFAGVLVLYGWLAMTINRLR
ncbi:MAG: hypothetical protein HY791_15475 [Deltaproteobacteria bacterium]|nr:hypothetical protein [Deltaproteobacteria bacterium]